MVHFAGTNYCLWEATENSLEKFATRSSLIFETQFIYFIRSGKKLRNIDKLIIVAYEYIRCIHYLSDGGSVF